MRTRFICVNRMEETIWQTEGKVLLKCVLKKDVKLLTELI